MGHVTSCYQSSWEWRKSLIALTLRVTRYTCPNGHPYSVGECTRPPLLHTQSSSLASCQPGQCRRAFAQLLAVVRRSAESIIRTCRLAKHSARPASASPVRCAARGLPRAQAGRPHHQRGSPSEASEAWEARPLLGPRIFRRHRSQPGYIAATSELVDWASGRTRNWGRSCPVHADIGGQCGITCFASLGPDRCQPIQATAEHAWPQSYAPGATRGTLGGPV